MKFYKIFLAVFIPVYVIYFIYMQFTGSILFAFLWSLAAIFGIYDLERFFADRKTYLTTKGIIFGMFFGSAFFVIDHTLVKTWSTPSISSFLFPCI